MNGDAPLEETFGGKAVGLTFNPSSNEDVNVIKRQCAEAINLLAGMREAFGHGEKSRMLSIAITEIQTAQMWAVKAVTWTE